MTRKLAALEARQLIRIALKRQLLRHLLGRPLLRLDLLLQVGVVLADLDQPALLGLQRVEIAATEIGPLTYRLQVVADAELVGNDPAALAVQLQALRLPFVDLLDDRCELRHSF